ncbi:GNAT family N-acetyltransferase [Gallaecimonas mangrovi]|uniref:GNAT family N-acetyltransferase n=1 Tax=Gallaecimonas mangrovi TaxID=2291597 RepID=UPI000E208090|nr:GNAT family N-acetyltransferase [Gallaecimonas mangrovi]
MTVARTERLQLRQLTVTDAPFILSLLNEPGWLANIGDKGVHNVTDARHYISAGPLAMYQRYGFGLFLVSLHDQTPIGLCGLIQRDYLPCPDLGYALATAYWQQGYAFEAAKAVMAFAKARNIDELKAITTAGNQASTALLKKLGFNEIAPITPPGSQTALRCFHFVPGSD